jgi:hypothetical protein
MKKSRINILIAVVITLIAANWFLGSSVYTKYPYRGFNRDAFADKAVSMWLKSMVENKQVCLKTYWPNDTIPVFSSNLKLHDINSCGIQVIVHPLDHRLPVDSCWVRIDLDKPPQRNPFSYTYDITAHYYSSWRADSTRIDSLTSVLKIEHWRAAYYYRKFRWVADTDNGVKTGRLF